MISKTCNYCNVTKEIRDFYTQPKNKDGYRKQCKSCIKSINHKWTQSNPDKVYEKAMRHRRKYPDKTKERDKKRNRQWVEKYPHKSRAKTAKRDAAKIQRTPKWLTKEQLNQIELIYFKCQELTKTTGIMYHVDHIIPLRGKNVCGLHVPWNLQILTATDNILKSNKV